MEFTQCPCGHTSCHSVPTRHFRFTDGEGPREARIEPGEAFLEGEYGPLVVPAGSAPGEVTPTNLYRRSMLFELPAGYRFFEVEDLLALGGREISEAEELAEREDAERQREEWQRDEITF